MLEPPEGHVSQSTVCLKCPFECLSSLCTRLRSSGGQEFILGELPHHSDLHGVYIIGNLCLLK